MKYSVFFFLLFISFSSCDKDEKVGPTRTNIDNNNNNIDDDCYEKSLNRGWIRRVGEKTYLFGGKGATDRDFDISDWKLTSCRLRFGLGREAFKALITPEYRPISETVDIYQDSDKCIYTISKENEVKVYPYKVLRENEVINETVDGKPVMIAYCILADLGVVYSREYCGTTLTFALSGYTYSDPGVWDGVDAFVMWDRETESLWWPLNDEGVSGKMLDEPLYKFSGQWKIETYKEITKKFPKSSIVRIGQPMDPPKNWPTFDNPCK